MVPKETLQLLSLVLTAACRLHAARETVAGHTPWQLVAEVQRKLLELGHLPESAVSDGWLTWFLENALVSRAVEPALVDVA